MSATERFRLYLEQSAESCHLRSIAVCLLQPLEESPFQAVLPVTSTLVVPAQWLCHLSHFNRSCLFVCLVEMFWRGRVGRKGEKGKKLGEGWWEGRVVLKLFWPAADCRTKAAALRVWSLVELLNALAFTCTEGHETGTLNSFHYCTCVLSCV